MFETQDIKVVNKWRKKKYSYLKPKLGKGKNSEHECGAFHTRIHHLIQNRMYYFTAIRLIAVVTSKLKRKNSSMPVSCCLSVHFVYQFAYVPIKNPLSITGNRICIDIYFLWKKYEWITKNVFVRFRWLKTPFSNFPWLSAIHYTSMLLFSP